MEGVIVELHDVSPFYYDETTQTIELFGLCGIEKFSLLLVPNFWESAPIHKNKSFIDAIKSTKQEIVLHGYNHRGGSWRDLLWTYKEGEFSGLSLEETYKKIDKAKEVFDALDIESYAFVPPAWLGNPFLEDVLYAFEFKVVAYRGCIKDLETGKTYPSFALSMSNRPLLSPITKSLSPILYKLFEKHKVLRLAVHTRDLRDKSKAVLWRHILSKVKKTRRLLNYGDFLSKSGLTPSL